MYVTVQVAALKVDERFLKIAINQGIGCHSRIYIYIYIYIYKRYIYILFYYLTCGFNLSVTPLIACYCVLSIYVDLKPVHGNITRHYSRYFMLCILLRRAYTTVNCLTMSLTCR